MDALTPGPPEPAPDGEFPGTDRELRSAMALSAAHGVEEARLRRLLDRVGSAADVVAGSGHGRARRACLRPDERRALREVEPAPRRELDRLRGRGVRVLSYRGPGYPRRLLHLHQPPPALYLRGPGDPARPRTVAVVGTRKATSYGRRAARDLAGDLARSGWSVVSGLARGIDAAAHRAALDAAGETVAVLGSGLRHRYPASNRNLYDRLEQDGLLVTEFAPDQPPQKWTFPKRNRIIAALSAGVVVVQAPRRSGALITVDQALELGREVFAVPGPVGAPASEGTHELLRSGAGLAARSGDVLRVLEGLVPAGEAGGGGSAPGRGDRTGASGSGGAGESGPLPAPGSSVDPAGAREVWSALEEGVEALEELSERCSLAPGRILALLAELELAGRVRRLPGDRYRPVSRAGR